jgi:hypothetical protein
MACRRDAQKRTASQPREAPSLPAPSEIQSKDEVMVKNTGMLAYQMRDTYLKILWQLDQCHP